jgi:hypothetical protein
MLSRWERIGAPFPLLEGPRTHMNGVPVVAIVSNNLTYPSKEAKIAMKINIY